MNAPAAKPEIVKERLTQFGALAVLLALGGLALAGPYGLLAWGENIALLEKRQDHIAELQAERDELKNRVALLDPNHADPDLVTELLRRDLNVAHPDEYVIELDDKAAARPGH
jgi:cell division protein FtsB